jgi:hypothetical protein
MKLKIHGKGQPVPPKPAPEPQPESRMSADQARDVKLGIAERFPSSFKIDTSLLSVAEMRELRELYLKNHAGFSGGYRRADLSGLDKKEQARYLELLDQGLPARAREQLRVRQEEALRQQVELLADQALAGVPGLRPRWEEPGSVTIPRDFFGAMTEGVFTVVDLGVLAAFLHMFSSRTLLVSQGRWEGDTIVWPGQSGFAKGVMAAGPAAGWKDSVDHLAANGWLTYKMASAMHRVSLGPIALTMWEDRAAAVPA